MSEDLARLMHLAELNGRMQMRQIVLDFISENRESASEDAKRVFNSLLQLLLETIVDEEKAEAPLPA